MELFNIIIGVIGALSAVGTLIIALFGINLGRKVSFKNETLYGTEAETRYNAVKDKLPKDRLYYEGLYEGGGGKIAPQFEVERFRYDPQTMDIQWKGTNKTVRYYYTDNGKTMVKSWKLK